MSPFKALILGYQWNHSSELLASIFPSVKYGYSLLLVVTFASFGGQVEAYMGFSGMTLVAFIVAALVELFSGIYASVKVKGDAFESGKFGRFLFKFILLMAGLFVVHQFGSGWEVKNPLIGSTFNWIYGFIFTEGALEYVISILENFATISGKPKDYYIGAITDKVASLFTLKART